MICELKKMADKNGKIKTYASNLKIIKFLILLFDLVIDFSSLKEYLVNKYDSPSKIKPK